MKKMMKILKSKKFIIPVLVVGLLYLVLHTALTITIAKSVENKKWDLHLTSNSSESDVIRDMHEMTHQKVRALSKWGAIPMNQDTINQVYKVVYENDFWDRDKLLTILNRWKAGDFSHVSDDHNYFWTQEDGDTGESIGNASKVEEAAYVLTHFGFKSK